MFPHFLYSVWKRWKRNSSAPQDQKLLIPSLTLYSLYLRIWLLTAWPNAAASSLSKCLYKHIWLLIFRTSLIPAGRLLNLFPEQLPSYFSSLDCCHPHSHPLCLISSSQKLKVQAACPGLHVLAGVPSAVRTPLSTKWRGLHSNCGRECNEFKEDLTWTYATKCKHNSKRELSGWKNYGVT